ncbi:MAG TPA: hypothetical protein VFV67_19260 [Actinophytocola sp.]|uniref:hypothetical protein n=1 Tax=Actinophytocola sp. TaxID=1872138 RepID=UPI002DBF4ED5|nr:hypothetical protein [Actinophytocola sp.]HEU5472791.1 hypothetical protein [Actinophytocola sp.]
MTLDAVWTRALLAAGLVAVALLGASLPTHALPSTVVVLVPSALILVLAVRRTPEPAEKSPRMRRGVLLWSLLALAGLAWEAYAFVRQPDWSRADPANPTLSTLLDPVLEQGPLRIAGWLLWLWAGWRLVTR